jgi:hypothetical protein
MRYALLIHYPQSGDPPITQDQVAAGKAAFHAYAKALEDAGVLHSAEILQTIAAATSSNDARRCPSRGSKPD